MDNAIQNILALRKRQHLLIKQIAKVDAEICAAMTDLVQTHGPKAGVSPDVMAASVEPKD